MAHGRPKQWTEAEARRLKTLVRQKVGAEGIARRLAGMLRRCEEKRDS
jgi:hypothetical protein